VELCHFTSVSLSFIPEGYHWRRRNLLNAKARFQPLLLVSVRSPRPTIPQVANRKRLSASPPLVCPRRSPPAMQHKPQQSLPRPGTLTRNQPWNRSFKPIAPESYLKNSAEQSRPLSRASSAFEGFYETRLCPSRGRNM
jgi:hypothetical protein